MKKDTPPEEEVVLPNNKEAEAGVLGAMILDNKIIPKALARLTEDAFWYTPHKIIFKGIADAYNKRQTVDLVILKDFIGEAIRDYGGMAYAASIVADTPNTENGLAYADAVVDKYRIREAIQASEKIKELAHGEAKLEEIYEVADKIKSRCNPSIHMGWSKCLSDALANIKDTSEQGVLLTTGWDILDENIGGVRKKTLYVVGGKTSQGKTSVCVNIAKANLDLTKARILYNGFENLDQFATRLAAIDSDVPLAWFLKPMNCGEAELKKVQDALHSLEKWKDNIVVMNSSSVTQMRAVADDFKPDIIFLDYMGRYVNKFSDDEGNRHVAHSKLVSDLQDLAIDKDAAVFAFSQLGRRAEDQRNRKPSINDLKESGDIENSADVVLLLWWPWRDSLDSVKHNPEHYHIMVAKNKLGECKDHTLRLKVDTLRLGEWGKVSIG